MGENYVGRDLDNSGVERAAAGLWSGGTLAKSAAYTITKADVDRAGGHLHMEVTSASAFDITLPNAFLCKGASITLHKLTASTDALAFDTSATNQIDAGTAGQRYQNVTAEQGSLTVWASPASTAAVGIWRIMASRGTWAAAA